MLKTVVAGKDQVIDFREPRPSSEFISRHWYTVFRKFGVSLTKTI